MPPKVDPEFLPEFRHIPKKIRLCSLLIVWSTDQATQTWLQCCSILAEDVRRSLVSSPIASMYFRWISFVLTSHKTLAKSRNKVVVVLAQGNLACIYLHEHLIYRMFLRADSTLMFTPCIRHYSECDDLWKRIRVCACYK